MASTQAETGRILAALQGQIASNLPHSGTSSPTILSPPLFSNGSTGGGQQQHFSANGDSHVLSSPVVAVGQAAEQQRSSIWQAPASVGYDLTNPVILGTVISLWPTLEEVQKINVLLGIAHVGLGKMHQAHAEALRISQLAKSDTTSDWVRTLGCIIGDVGVNGKINYVDSIPEPTKAEIEKAVNDLADALERSELRLATRSLEYVSGSVAKGIAPASIRNVYGRSPKRSELENIVTQAKKAAASLQSPSNSRRPSAAYPLSSRSQPGSNMDTAAGGSNSSSRLGSPEPSDKDFSAFSELFSESGNGDKELGSDDDSESEQGGELPAYSLGLKVKGTHQTDHVGRMARLLAAAREGAAAATSVSRHDGPAVARRPSAAALRGAARSAPGIGVRRGMPGPSSSPAGAKSRIGMLAPRRRGAPSNLALPAAGSGTTGAARKGSSDGPLSGIAQAVGKKIQMMDFQEAASSVNDRERTLKAKREQAAEEREAKRAKIQADKEERKRLREEARLMKTQPAVDRSGGSGRRGSSSSRRATVSPSASDRNGNGDGRPIDVDSSDGEYAGGYPESGESSGNEASSPPPPSRSRKRSKSPAQPSFDVPLDYLTFSGHDQQIRDAVYTNANALTENDRLLMYCFFNARQMPPGTSNVLEIVLSEQTVEDPTHQGRSCREMMVFQADVSKGEWKKVRRLRRS
ncbi:hypothetical protein IW140_000074 [Coemansia sp. RSA 1813]|nr:hypothetical protein EV178_000123 [Coemansia sp. RSA 1646]KAJ1771461.1 hypothetical protein LPJ74_002280 [Coemansia sp. RSA 1843]KAJ2093179.1 hypothetical protein IW138_000471 [Coemansia sp. RSA 986]KAJ2217556.1 hypothetical protein EV179_000391 [Coemansia sp. RSA 487]KAJ2573433.1 hypothetical protein IW140_000074 [Coemansia sp. RSA 1813]